MSRLLRGSGGEEKDVTSVMTGIRWIAVAALLLCLPATVMADAGGGAPVKTGALAPTITTIKADIARGNPRIEEYALPTRYSTPYGIAVDSKDRVWVTEMSANALAVFDPATGQMKEYRIPSTSALPDTKWEYDPRKSSQPKKIINNYSVGNPGNMMVDANDTVWFVMQLGNSVVRFEPGKEKFTEFQVPTPNARPYDLAEGPDGRIWFVEKNAGKIGYLDVKGGKIHELKVGKSARMMGIAVDGKGYVWIGDVAGNYLGRYNPETRGFKRYPINVPGSQPGQMRIDGKGNLWVCNLRVRQLGIMMTGQGIYSVVDLPGSNSVPQGLALTDDNKVWIVDSMTNQIGYFDSAHLDWKIFSIPTGNSQPMNVAVDSKGDAWFTQSDRSANKIARLVTSTIPATTQNPALKTGATRNTATGGNEVDHETETSAIMLLASALVVIILFAGFIVIRRFR